MNEKKKREQHQTERKKITDKEWLNKLTEIHKLIKDGTYSGNYPNIEDLIAWLSKDHPDKPIGVATVYRYLAMLRSTSDEGFHAPIEFDKAKNGYYYTNPKYEFGISSTTPEKLFSLISTKQLLSTLSDTPIYKKLSDLTNFITENQDTSQKNLMGRTLVIPKPYIKNNDSWDLLVSSISENRKINLKIYNSNKEIDALFSPYRLIVDSNNFLYLEGLAEIELNENETIVFSDFYNEITRTSEKGEVISETLFLNFSQIEILNLSEEVYALPEDYKNNSKFSPLLSKKQKMDAASLMKNMSFEFSFSTETTEKEKLTIKVTNDTRKVFENYSFSDDQSIEYNSKDDSLIVTLTPKCLDVCKWLLSFGADVQPVSPVTIVHQWKQEIKKMYKISNPDN